MDTQTIPTVDQLMQWQNATSWCRLVLQQKIVELEKWKISHEYDDVSLARLDELEAFLNTLQNQILAEQARVKFEEVLERG